MAARDGKYRAVTTAAGYEFQVPTNVSRVDSKEWHGWQVRVKRKLSGAEIQAQWVPDRGTGFAAERASLNAASEMADAWRTAPKVDRLQDGAGVDLDVRCRDNSVQLYVIVRRPNSSFSTHSFYVGTFMGTATQERYELAYARALAKREEQLAIARSQKGMLA